MYYYESNYRVARNTSDIRADNIRCNWPTLRAQILLQWKRLKSNDLDHTNGSRKGVALLIQQEYGIASELVENYLSNVERCLPAT